MVWWLFRKKEGNNWENLHNSLKDSFSNIKKDMGLLNNWLGQHKSKLQEHEQNHLSHKESFSMILNRLDRLEELLMKSDILSSKQQKEIQEESKELVDISLKSNTDKALLNDLTNVQKSLLIRLAILLKESNLKWISMRGLSQEIYPDKDHESIKSMMSIYSDILLNLGLIEKKRKGRDIFLTVTKKAYQILPKNMQRQQIKVIKKKTKKNKK